MEENGYSGIFSLLVGSGSVVGEKLISDKRVPLISFTGSTKMGRHVSETVSSRFGKCILELGGNNANYFLNRTVNDGDDATKERLFSYLTLMEVSV